MDISMRRMIILLVGIVLIASCTNRNNNSNVRESEEYLRLQAQLDSVKAQSAAADVQAAAMMTIISEVEANFERIRAAERIISTQSAQGGEMSADTRTQVNDNFRMINEILQRNRTQLVELERKAQGGTTELTALRATVTRLQRELESSVARVTELQSTLALRDAQIAQLSQDVVDIANENEQQAATIQEQDRTIHTAFYVFGTMSELRTNKILSGGFLQQTRVLQDTFNREYFLQIDIRRTTEIPLYARKAKLWSTHPDGTYELTEGDDRNLTLVITDTQRFWSLTKYLIVEV
jgi:predicted  nucleic acid-binding Zn-ribbon protein